MKLAWKWLITLAILVAVIVAEVFYNEPLFEESLDIIVTLQNQFPNQLKLWKIVSDIGLALVVIITVLVVLLYPFKYSSHYFLTFDLALYCVYTLKNIYHNYRPYWVKLLIDEGQREVDYGNPSGHAFLVTSAFLGLCATHYNYKLKASPGKGKLIMGFGIAFMLVLIVLYSRLILGVHSINQLIYGFSLSLSIVYLSYYLWADKILDYIESIQSMCTKCFHNIFISTAVFVLLMLNEFIIHYLFKGRVTLPARIMDIIRIKNPNATNDFPIDNAFSDSGVTTMFLGYAIGLYVERFIFHINSDLIREELWKYKAKLALVVLLKIVIAGVLVGVIYLVMPESMWGSFVLKVIAANLMAVFLFGISNKLLITVRLQSALNDSGIRSQLLDKSQKMSV